MKARIAHHSIPDLEQPKRLQVCRGEMAKAVYRGQEIEAYDGNPLIESLPAIYSEKEVARLLRRHTPVNPRHRNDSAEIRLHRIYGSILNFFRPLSPHLDLEQRISRMIRAAYSARNPASLQYLGLSRKRLEAFKPGMKVSPCVQSAAMGFTLVGMPGMGKTTALIAILQSLYPQVIQHVEYKNKPFTLMQLVWLKLECPSDGSIRGLCLNFLQAVDDILGTTYYANYRRLTVDELVAQLPRIATNHSMGLLVIDEIQHLSQAKSGGAERMLNFFVQLVNIIGVPVVLVGTYKAMKILGSEFRQIRRAGGQGEFIWDCWKKDSSDWDLLLKDLWQYQYVKHPIELTDDVRETLYDLTQGITDYLIKVFMLAQFRAIETGREKLDINILRSVAKDSLRQAAPVLNALRMKNYDLLALLKDTLPTDMDGFLEDANRAVSRAKGRKGDVSNAQALDNALPTQLSLSDIEHADEKTAKEAVKPMSKKREGDHKSSRRGARKEDQTKKAEAHTPRSSKVQSLKRAS